MFINMQKPNFCKCYTTGSRVGQSKFAVWWKVSRKCEPRGNMFLLIPKLPPFPSCLSSSAPSPPRQEGSPTCSMFWSLLRSLWQDLFHFHSIILIPYPWLQGCVRSHDKTLPSTCNFSLGSWPGISLICVSPVLQQWSVRAEEERMRNMVTEEMVKALHLEEDWACHYCLW